MSSDSQAELRDIDDVLPGSSPDDLLNTLHDPSIYWGPTYEQPLRGRPIDELEILHRNNLDGICNLCNHLLVRLSNEWRCSERPCTLPHPMMGCVPKSGGWDRDQ